MQSGMGSGYISRKTKRITRQNLGHATPLDAAQPLPTDLLCPIHACILKEPLEPFFEPEPEGAPRTSGVSNPAITLHEARRSPAHVPEPR